MANFLHTFEPTSILVHLGPVTIYWYGLCVVLGVISAISVSIFIGKKYGLNNDRMVDLSLWLIIAGIVGARIYDVLLELPYYLDNPINILKVWRGGLAIHGGLISGAIALWIFAKKEKINLWLLTDAIVPGIALGQAIGRWGNYFNQELFGYPTNASWGIPIAIDNRPQEFINMAYYHPTFLYESIGDLIIFAALLCLHICRKGTKSTPSGVITSIYLFLYSILRFFLEFIRVDYAPTVGALRWPQWASIALVVLASALLIKSVKGAKVQNSSHTFN